MNADSAPDLEREPFFFPLLDILCARYMPMIVRDTSIVDIEADDDDIIDGSADDTTVIPRLLIFCVCVFFILCLLLFKKLNDDTDLLANLRDEDDGGAKPDTDVAETARRTNGAANLFIIVWCADCN